MKTYKQLEKEAFHVHTFRCKHAGDEPDEAYVQKAIELSAARIVFTDHSPFPGNRFLNRMEIEDLPEYIRSMKHLKEKYSGRIEVVCGLEADYLPSFSSYYRELSEMEGMDLLILGQHFYEKPDGHPSYEDTDRSQEAKGICEAIVQGMETGLFCVLAHPDRTFKRGKDFGEEEIECSEQIIRTAQKYNVYLERNYSSMNRKRNYWPEFWKLVPPSAGVVWGIDAHSVKELEQGWKGLYETLERREKQNENSILDSEDAPV